MAVFCLHISDDKDDTVCCLGINNYDDSDDDYRDDNWYTDYAIKC